MGIPRGTARLLLEEAKRRPFSGSLLQLGRSSVYFTQEELERWAGLHGVELSPVDEVSLSHDPRLARQGCLSDESLFRQLGFDRVHACDISDWEGADVIVDLNRPVPEEHAGRFDAVLDPGTTIQIFDLPRVLGNLHRFLAPEGRVIHAAVPSNNHMDLGFYMACPTLFWDFWGANGYERNLSDRHWIEFGAVLERLHTAVVPPALLRRIRRETFSPGWRDTVTSFLGCTMRPPRKWTTFLMRKISVRINAS